MKLRSVILTAAQLADIDLVVLRCPSRHMIHWLFKIPLNLNIPIFF